MNTEIKEDLENCCLQYAKRLVSVISSTDWANIGILGEDIRRCWLEGRQVFLCGNGGSAGNAIHLANDLLYGVSKQTGAGIKVQALSANQAVITCLANDIDYESIYSEQLAVLAEPGDLLVVLSGSGNSPNIISVLEQAKKIGVKSCAILGYTGGKCKAIADLSIHFPVDDMQISEDMQLIVGHMIMKWLSQQEIKVIV